MKKILVTVLFMLPMLLLAQVEQRGFVRLKVGRAGEKSVPLAGVRISAYKANTVKSGENGNFTLVFSGKHYADSITLLEISKFGYELLSSHLLKKGAWNLSPKNSLNIVMVKTSDRIIEQNEIEQNIRKSLKSDFQKKLQTLETQLESQTITIENYQRQYSELLEKYQNTSWISEEAERLSRTDYADLDSNEARMLDYRKQGLGNEMVALSKNVITEPVLSQISKNPNSVSENIRKQEEKLAQERKYRDFLAQQLLNIADGFRLTNDYDSVGYYLEIRADLDKDSFDYQMDLAGFLSDQKRFSDLKAVLDEMSKISDLTKEQHGDLLFTRAKYYYAENQFDEAEKSYLQSLDFYGMSPTSVETDFKIAKVRMEYGYLCYKQNRLTEARKNYDAAMASLQRLYSEDNRLCIRELSIVSKYMASVYCALQNFDEAEKSYHQSLEYSRNIPSEELSAFEQSLKHIGMAEMFMLVNDFDKSLAAARKSETILERLFAENPEAYALEYTKALGIQALNFNYVKKFDSAEVCYLKSLEILSKRAELCPLQYEKYLAETYNSIAGLYSDMNRLDEAGENYVKSLDIWQRLADQNPDAFLPSVATSLNNLGWLHSAQKDYVTSEKYFSKAIAVYRTLARNNPDVFPMNLARSLNNIGMIHEMMDSLQSAEKEYDEAISIYRKVSRKNTSALPYQAIALNNLAKLYEVKSKWKKAESAYLEAVQIFAGLEKSTPKVYNYYMFVIYSNIAKLKQKQGSLREAEKNFVAAKNMLQPIFDDNPEIYRNDYIECLQDLQKIYAMQGNASMEKETNVLIERCK